MELSAEGNVCGMQGGVAFRHLGMVGAAQERRKEWSSQRLQKDRSGAIEDKHQENTQAPLAKEGAGVSPLS